MQDYTLGGPIACDDYYGGYLDGEPLHDGYCNDGVYGCEHCARAMQRMSPEARVRYDLQNGADDDESKDMRWTDTCEFCTQVFDIVDMSFYYDAQERCKYRVCTFCRERNARQNAALEAQDEPDDYVYTDYDVPECDDVDWLPDDEPTEPGDNA